MKNGIFVCWGNDNATGEQCSVNSKAALWRDSLVDYWSNEAAFMAAASGEPREAVLIGGADHIFNVFDGGKDYADRAIGTTVSWFKRTLVFPAEETQHSEK